MVPFDIPFYVVEAVFDVGTIARRSVNLHMRSRSSLRAGIPLFA
jgi:hypothetical protein